MAIFKYKNADINYYVNGEGIPVLMIHGFHINHVFLQSGLEPVFEELGNKFKRYYIDLPGMGNSTAGDITSSSEICEMLVQFAKEIMNDEPFIIVGHSYGGFLTRGMIHYLGKKILGAFFVCPVVDIPMNKPNVPKGPIVPYKKDDAFFSTLSPEMQDAYSGMNVKQTEEMYSRYVHDIYQPLQLADKHFLYDVLETKFDFNLSEDENNSNFDNPVLILTAKGDTSVGYRDQVTLMDLYKNSAYHVLEHAGHHITMDQPELFHCIAKNWFEENFI